MAREFVSGLLKAFQDFDKELPLSNTRLTAEKLGRRIVNVLAACLAKQGIQGAAARAKFDVSKPVLSSTLKDKLNALEIISQAVLHGQFTKKFNGISKKAGLRQARMVDSLLSCAAGPGVGAKQRLLQNYLSCNLRSHEVTRILPPKVRSIASSANHKLKQ